MGSIRAPEFEVIEGGKDPKAIADALRTYWTALNDLDKRVSLRESQKTRIPIHERSVDPTDPLEGNAIIWMSDRRYENRVYRGFEVFLFRNARIAEPAGTVTEGPLLYVTLGSWGAVRLSVDKRAFASSEETTVYRDAASVRERVRAGGLGTGIPEPLSPLTVEPDEIEFPLPPPEFSFSAKKTSISKLENGQHDRPPHRQDDA